MGSMSSNGTKAFKAPKKQIGGSFFGAKELQTEGFRWQDVDGDLLRMVLDSLTWRGWGMAFFLAPGGRGIKVKLYTDTPAKDAVVIRGAEMNALLQFVLNDIATIDDEAKAMFNEVSDWLESRDR